MYLNQGLAMLFLPNRYFTMKYNLHLILLLLTLAISSCKKEECDKSNNCSLQDITLDDILNIEVNGVSYNYQVNNGGTRPSYFDIYNDSLIGGPYGKSMYFEEDTNGIQSSCPFVINQTGISIWFPADSSDLLALNLDSSYSVHNDISILDSNFNVLSTNFMGDVNIQYHTYPDNTYYVPIPALTGHRITDINYVGRECRGGNTYAIYSIKGEVECKIIKKEDRNENESDFKELSLSYNLYSAHKLR